MLTHHRNSIVFLVFILSAAVFSACNSSGTTRARSDTLVNLRAMAYDIWMVKAYMNEPAPTTIPELAEWVARFWGFPAVELGPPWNQYFEKGQLLDSWGEPIVLIVEDEKLVAVASKGQDRTWRGATGDDIVVPIPPPPPIVPQEE